MSSWCAMTVMREEGRWGSGRSLRDMRTGGGGEDAVGEGFGRRDGESRQLGGSGRKREQPTPLHPLFPDDLCLHRSIASTR
jgi:hypothetical protein